MVGSSLLSVICGNIVVFVAGTAITWSSPMIPKLNATSESPFGHATTQEQTSWVASLVSLGAAFGPFLCAFASDKYGRKPTLLALAVPFFVAFVCLAFAGILPLFYFARFLMGVSVGGVFTVLPMYVAEIALKSNRGALGSALNCFVTFGQIFSYAVGPYVSVRTFNVLLAAFPVAFFAAFCVAAPESPHYYVKRGLHREAKSALRSIRGAGRSEAELSREFEDIRGMIESTKSGVSFLDLLTDRGLVKALIISCALVGFQQLSGIGAIMFYAETIFASSGNAALPAEIASMVVGGVQFSTSFLTPLITDRLGRKILLIISAAGMVAAQIPLGIYFYLKDDGSDISRISWLPIICTIFYIVMYNLGFGPLPWTVMGEIFPANVKCTAAALTASFCWIISFLVTKFFQSVSNSIGIGASFWIFAGFCGLALLFSLLYVFETKGKSLQEIQEILGNVRNKSHTIVL